MNLVQKQRLLNVAHSLRESPNPKGFTMSCYVRGERYDDESPENFCGTPACALGHLGSRTDLQKIVHIGLDVNKKPSLKYVKGNRDVGFDDKKLQEYFGITPREALALFSGDGCNEARTPLQAAKFIEKFVLKHD